MNLVEDLCMKGQFLDLNFKSKERCLLTYIWGLNRHLHGIFRGLDRLLLISYRKMLQDVVGQNSSDNTFLCTYELEETYTLQVLTLNGITINALAG